jgi:hypothetical protein
MTVGWPHPERGLCVVRVPGNGVLGMAEGQRRDVDEITERNVAGARALLARKHQQERQRDGEPPLTDDPNVPAQEDQLADEATGVRGSTGGIRNMGGGRS